MMIKEILDNQLGSLSKEVFYCTKCVNSNQRPRITFDETRVCDACRYCAEKENLINWDERECELMRLLDKHRSNDGSYDVIVPSSGGKDSCYVAHQLKYVYGMHPLTVTWAPAMYTDIGWRNMIAFTRLFDNILCTPNREAHGKLSRLGFELIGDPFDPWHYGQRTFPLHMALRYRIPLIMYGEKTGAEYGGREKEKCSPEETKKDRDEKLFYRGAEGVDTLVQVGLKYGRFSKSEINEKTFDVYRLPSEKDIADLQIKVHWYSYYKKWVPQDNYYYAQKHCGFEPNPERSEGTYSKYASIDDKIDGLHFYMQYIKFGFGRCTSEASQEIRSGHIDREEGVALVRKYDGEFPRKYFKECLEYMNMTEEEFHQTVDKFRLPHIWEKDNDKWTLKHTVE
jgi:N-acetyl sugar amidotransferase